VESKKLCVVSVCRQGLRAVRSCVLCQYLTGAEDSKKVCVVSVSNRS
jgi:hypothetical protein